MSASALTLRPFQPGEAVILLGRLRGWMPDAVAANENHWRGVVEKRVRDSGGWSPDDNLDYAIEIDGELAGAVQALNEYYRLPPKVYELGIEFFGTSYRGHGLGGEVLRRFIPDVFEHGAIRLQGRTHVENTPMIRLFQRFGFVCEGIMRSYWPLEGASGDMGLWALTRADYARPE